MKLTVEEKKCQVKAGLIIGGMFLLMLLLSGCATENRKEYYETGQIKSEYSREGFVNWSDGEGKQMPLSNISLNGVGVGK